MILIVTEKWFRAPGDWGRMKTSRMGWETLPIHIDTRGILSSSGVLGCFQLSLDHFCVDLAVSERCYVILWCERIGEGGMERKKVNHRGAPGVSLDCCSPQHGFPTILVEGQGCLSVSCQMHGPKKQTTHSSVCCKLEFWSWLAWQGSVYAYGFFWHWI